MTSNSNKIPAFFAGAAGLLCFTAVPYITIKAMSAVLQGIAVKVQASGNPLITSAPKIVIGFFPVWGGLTVAAGMALLLVAKSLYEGESWAKPAAVGLLAIPSITGAYFSGPIMFFAASKMYFFVIVALIGLIPYFLILLWGKGSGRDKLGKFFLFLMLGVTAAWSFSNGGSSLRMFWARPEPVSLPDTGNLGFLMGFPVVWIGVLCVVVGIPFLVAAKQSGYRLSSIGLLVILAGSVILLITHPTTNEFLAGIIMAIISLVLLWMPGIGGKLINSSA